MSDFALSADSALEYLRRRGTPIEGWKARALGGGVSNTVVLIESAAGAVVLKQSLPRLRVADEWLADRSRILRERDALEAAARLLPRGWVPRVLWSEDADFLYAMEAFAGEARSWKEHLLAGRLDAGLARRAGLALSLTIRGSWRSEEFERLFGDQQAFRQLRVDPYYATIARRRPEIAAAARAWIEEFSAARVALTHGDWSPKNMIVDGSRLIFIDYECAHFGDPCFDAAFALNHLCLKAVHLGQQAHEFLRLARVFFTWTLAALPAAALADFERRSARHLAFLLLARVDGKSPVEYLTSSERERVRELALRLIAHEPDRIEPCLRLAAEAAGR